MFHPITGESFNELALNAYKACLNGRKQDSRNGPIRCVNNAVMTLTDPRKRHLFLEGRKSNIAAQIAETFWVMAGDSRIDPLLSFFLPRAKDYSDDGLTWRGAYGPRLYMYDQLKEAVEVFKTDGLTTRQSVIQILLPALDSKIGLSVNYDLESTKDRPCNNEIVFFCTPNEDGSYNLNMNVFQRSGDAIWGALNINVFEWTFLQELVLNALNEQHEEVIFMGEYTHFVTNLHVYDATSSQAENAVNELRNHTFGGDPVSGCIYSSGNVMTDQEFFKSLVEFYSMFIEDKGDFEFDSDRHSYSFAKSALWKVFSDHRMPKEGIMWDYAMIVLIYIFIKQGLLSEGFNDNLQYFDVSHNPDLQACLQMSSFIKWEC